MISFLAVRVPDLVASGTLNETCVDPTFLRAFQVLSIRTCRALYLTEPIILSEAKLLYWRIGASSSHLSLSVNFISTTAKIGSCPFRLASNALWEWYSVSSRYALGTSSFLIRDLRVLFKSTPREYVSWILIQCLVVSNRWCGQWCLSLPMRVQVRRIHVSRHMHTSILSRCLF